MRRKQIYLDEEQDRRIKLLARKDMRTESEVIREALGEYLSRRDPPGDGPLAGLIGIVEGGPADGSVNHDRYIYEGRRKAFETKQRRR